ncbi:MAG: carboxylating nicotinate-nucleotide diphosphorylase [Alphaproteobacteria bacterium]
MQRPFDLDGFLAAALAEDIAGGDITTESVVPAGAAARFALVAREELVVAGLEFLPALFRLLDPGVVVKSPVGEGEKVEKGTQLALLEGPARALLTGERTALNLLQHLSGIATLTRRYVEAVAGTDARILDTRKTLPGLRFLEKYAVAMGGGLNHRMGLYDAVLIKDNHLAIAGSIAKAVEAARRRSLE